MAEKEKPLLIKRYASRRLYNTETSDYVTLEDIAGFIRDGRNVQIVDLKSGDVFYFTVLADDAVPSEWVWRGEAHRLVRRPIEGVRGLDWDLAIVVPERELTGVARDNAQQTLGIRMPQ